MLKWTICLLACAMTLGAVGCSGGSSHNTGKDAASSSTSTSTTVAVPKTATGGDLTAFCAAYREIRQLASSALSAGPTAQQPAAIRDHYTKVGEAGKRMQAAAPSEIRHVVDVAMQINDEVVASGSLQPFDSDQNKQNGPLLAAYADRQCKVPG